MPRGRMSGSEDKGRAGKGRGFGRGGGQGRMGGEGAGPGGNCVCPNCGTKVVHQARVPCYSISCPNCGTKMTRE